jgi:Tfp pilus assembly protein PilF
MELERAVQLDPNFIAARLALLEFYVVAPAVAGGSETAAMEQASEIRKRDAIDGHRAFARVYTAAKKPDLARKEHVDMVKEQPASARAHYWFGVHLMLTEKNYKAASDEFESAVKLDPSYMPAYFQIGHVAVLAANNLARGEETLKKYLAYRPKDEEPSVARAHYWLGGIYEKQGKKAEAMSNYAASLKINPNQKDVGAAMKRVS